MDARGSSANRSLGKGRESVLDQLTEALSSAALDPSVVRDDDATQGGHHECLHRDASQLAIGAAGQAQPEVLMEIMAGGGGTQYLTALVGRARALEILLGAQLVDAELAERYGLVSRALPADEIHSFVDALARRIGGLQPAVVSAVKTAVNAAPSPITRAGLAAENALLGPLFTPAAADRAHVLLAAGMQTRDGELRLESVISGL